jgi:hypothetical protein
MSIAPHILILAADVRMGMGDGKYPRDPTGRELGIGIVDSLVTTPAELPGLLSEN